MQTSLGSTEADSARWKDSTLNEILSAYSLVITVSGYGDLADLSCWVQRDELRIAGHE